VDVVWLATVAAYPILVLILDMVIRILAVIYIPRNRRPQTALAWLVLIFVVPVPGILVFFLFGSRRLPAAGGASRGGSNANLN
jgi:cardiolipin synthase A/B